MKNSHRCCSSSCSFSGDDHSRFHGHYSYRNRRPKIPRLRRRRCAHSRDYNNSLLDYGDAQTIDANNRRCLVGANLSVRRKVFEAIGNFTAQFQKVKGSVCGVEDHEFQERYWNAGGRCRFDPSMVVYASIQPARLDKSYHRRWHYSHGQMHALLREPSMESSAFSIRGIPGHIYRALISESAATLLDLLRLRSNEAFSREVQARFCAGFISQRLRDNNSE